MLYGRDPERARIGALLEGARSSRSGALVVRGEPGIGKSALLEDARERAADMHVLAARGVESESELPFAALHQLLRPVLALDYLERLAPAQATALESALGAGDGTAPEPFLVFTAFLSLLSELAERRPVLCLVDDAHWLDTASANALRFVARRLDAEGIVMLFGAREGDIRTFEAEDVPSLVLEGLDIDAAAILLSRRAGIEPAPSVRATLVERARGNALALLELPAPLSESQLAGDEPLPEALPLTRQVESVFLERVHRLPEEAQRLLLVAAADDSETVALVTKAAARLDADAGALDAAERAGLVAIHGQRLEFRHPLVRSAVYEAATSNDRRAAHRALADALAKDDEQADRRAWHLAASVLEPDEAVVRALEEAAGRAERRAAYLAAAKALVRAAELSADTEARGRRLVGAARSARIAGADEHAAMLANQALPLVDDALLRAEVAYALGVAEVRRGRPLDGFPLLVEAARDIVALDPGKALELLIWATGAAGTGGNPAALAQVSEVAGRVASIDGDEESVHVVRALAGVSRAMQGDSEAAASDLDEAIDWASASDHAQHVFAVSVAALFSADHARFTMLINRAISLARARGELGLLAEAQTMRAAGLLMVQRFDEAALAAGEAEAFARELGAINAAVRPLSILAYVAAIRGDADEARRRAEEVLEVTAAHGLALGAANAVYALAMLDLGQGRWAEALERLEVLADPRQDFSGTVVAKLALPDTIEAAVRAGRTAKAHEALSAFGEWAARAAPAWAQPRLASARALLAEGDEATALFEDALGSGPDARPFDLARIQLLFGEHLRRERRRTDSRVQLRAALEGFERFRAEPWAERARTELRASGETARKRDPSTLSQLTPQELQIARFVAEGLTNKEIAAQLFLSPRTIDSHLRNVFAKLGITSRTQLARLPLGEVEPVAVSA